MNGRSGQMRRTTTAEVRLDRGKATGSGIARRAIRRFRCQGGWLQSNLVVTGLDETEDHARRIGNPGNVGLIGAVIIGGAIAGAPIIAPYRIAHADISTMWRFNK